MTSCSVVHKPRSCSCVSMDTICTQSSRFCVSVQEPLAYSYRCGKSGGDGANCLAAALVLVLEEKTLSGVHFCRGAGCMH